MRRINDLTKELKQRGFAESSFEAIQQANQIYGSDDIEDNVKHGIISKSAHERINKDETMGNDSVSYNDRKIAKMTESVEMLTSKMNEMIRAINDLDARLTELKSKHDKLAATRQTVAEPRQEVKIQTDNEDKHVQPEAKPVAKEEHAEHAQTQAQKKDDYDVNQRTGSFQSQDVAIDKMFYFGNKK
jgi:hypothetical protein